MNNTRNRACSLQASTPTANYIITPKSFVCPGQLTKNVNKLSGASGRRRSSQNGDSKTSSKPTKLWQPSAVQPVTPKSSLVVSQTQGIVEIHLKHVDLSTTGKERIANLFHGATPQLRISWKFLSFERSSIPLVNPNAKDSHYQIESSVLYKVDINENFLDYIETRELSLELYARGNNNEVFLARAELKLNDILEYPTNELYANVDLCDVDKALVLSFTGIAVVYGNLALWYRLNCEKEVLGSLSKKTGQFCPGTTTANDKSLGGRNKSVAMTMFKNPEQRRQSGRISLIFQSPEPSPYEGDSVNSLEPTESETESFRDALQLVLSRNKALRTTQSEISNELRDRAGWLHEESNWKRTLQEHAILSGNDPSKVEWRQWRDHDTSNVRLRNYPSQVVIYKPEVVISVEYLKVYKNTKSLINKFRKFYVEYSFLTHDGEEMESEFGVASDGDKIIFNFTKTFSINPETNKEHVKKLAEAVKNGKEIKFVVVGQPEKEPNTILCCEEVSSCAINMLELLESESNELTDSLPLNIFNKESIEIGYLEISISGIQAMRRLALQLLAPPGYNILE